MSDLLALTRRSLLLGSGVLFAGAYLPQMARAAGRDPRFLVVILRGGLDGLGVVAPIGDPDWRNLRGDKALMLDGPSPALPLDDFFALNPAMPNLHRLYRASQALVVHAVATPYRERSHFDGQDVLEPTRAGSTARFRPWHLASRCRRVGGKPLQSGRLRLWSCEARPRCYRGCRRDYRRSAMIR